ncbi:unnamed protein product [Rotaria sp. Silwood1]|nr:unnamed protein product [Rotaria sp. Silwood1]CAF0949234.1 unnamed protein product [Rotaria sp. Silwood1]CAF3396586.1 unnamed protein product [Rotaria sp. Silwood1]CAF4527027.1 unnamed protein product [Rotaria sp. Silwood1]CAF4605134.1 unnamed protein product [Rotaria sp. Silwood1]
MLKLVAALLVLVVACNAFFPNVGGYTDRPDLVNSDLVKGLTVYAAEVLATTQNLFLTNLRTIKVQIQVVNGLNYKIDFSAEPVDGAPGQKTTCQVVINVRPDSIKNLIQSQCQTS